MRSAFRLGLAVLVCVGGMSSVRAAETADEHTTLPPQAREFRNACLDDEDLRDLFRDPPKGCACMATIMRDIFSPDELGFIIAQIRTDLFDLDSPDHHRSADAFNEFLHKLERSDERLKNDCARYLQTFTGKD